MSSQIRLARECYLWIDYFYFDLEFPKGVQSSNALSAQIFLIINGLRGRQVFMFPKLLNCANAEL
jgi:hypothetical protein